MAPDLPTLSANLSASVASTTLSEQLALYQNTLAFQYQSELTQQVAGIHAQYEAQYQAMLASSTTPSPVQGAVEVPAPVTPPETSDTIMSHQQCDIQSDLPAPAAKVPRTSSQPPLVSEADLNGPSQPSSEFSVPWEDLLNLSEPNQSIPSKPVGAISSNIQSAASSADASQRGVSKLQADR